MITAEESIDRFGGLAFERQGVVVIHLYQTGLGPSPALPSILEELGRVLSSDIRINSINIDTQPQWAIQFGASGVAETIVFRNGAELGRVPSFAPGDRFISIIRRLFDRMHRSVQHPHPAR